MEEWKTKKYPQPTQNAIKKSLSWVWRAEDRKNTREEKKKADKKENAQYCNLTYNIARFNYIYLSYLDTSAISTLHTIVLV